MYLENLKSNDFNTLGTSDVIKKKCGLMGVLQNI